MLAAAGVPLERKGMALGFRVEHPQAHINRLSYGPELAWAVRTGKARTDELNAASNPPPPDDAAEAAARVARLEGKLPVASYRLAASVAAGARARRMLVLHVPGRSDVPCRPSRRALHQRHVVLAPRLGLGERRARRLVPPDEPALAEYKPSTACSPAWRSSARSSGARSPWAAAT